MPANRKSKEGPQHAGRDAQFRHINRQVKALLLGTGDPVISVDAKKKELVGPFKNGGCTWRPKGKPQEVNTKDFPSLAQGKALPLAPKLRPKLSREPPQRGMKGMNSYE